MPSGRRLGDGPLDSAGLARAPDEIPDDRCHRWHSCRCWLLGRLRWLALNRLQAIRNDRFPPRRSREARGQAPSEHPPGDLRLLPGRRGLFPPRRQGDHLPGRAQPAPSVFLTPKPNQDDYQIFTADLAPDAKPSMVSTGKGACTCAYYHPDGKSILFASTHLNPSPSAPAPAVLAVGQPLPLELPRRAWTSSGPTSTARTSSA